MNGGGPLRCGLGRPPGGLSSDKATRWSNAAGRYRETPSQLCERRERFTYESFSQLIFQYFKDYNICRLLCSCYDTTYRIVHDKVGDNLYKGSFASGNRPSQIPNISDSTKVKPVRIYAPAWMRNLGYVYPAGRPPREGALADCVQSIDRPFTSKAPERISTSSPACPRRDLPRTLSLGWDIELAFCSYSLEVGYPPYPPIGREWLRRAQAY
ncbi:hypothetical protein EVAR_15784_1 [Eumeta japonica]|uniref:Uncharacterized protein n=1 Tax=Eumeta variegata TaxID=151549 RepID=A0A4C1U0U7_EUMVA|nr:hypothetical protein EVAR_15784_1 [Eumeta japonica]